MNFNYHLVSENCFDLIFNALLWFILIVACCQYNVAHLVYTSTYNVVFGGQVIRNGDESLPYLPLDKVILDVLLSCENDLNTYLKFIFISVIPS